MAKHIEIIVTISLISDIIAYHNIPWYTMTSLVQTIDITVSEFFYDLFKTDFIPLIPNARF